MDLKIFYDNQIDQAIIKGKNVGIIGYGSQAQAHAKNLRDSGVVNLMIGLKEDSKSVQKAAEDGFVAKDAYTVASWSSLCMILIPDELQQKLYLEIESCLQQNSTLAFAHGFSINFNLINPRKDLDVIMIAPKGPGYMLRSSFLDGGGLPCLVATSQNVSSNAFQTALSYASAIGCGKAGIIETTFKDECETDLFGEQAVLCGGVVELMKAGFNTLIDAGYPKEIAFFECVHEVKLVVDLIYKGGFAAMRDGISNTAEYGGFVSGKKIIDEHTKRNMKEVLNNIISGKFAQDWMLETGTGINGPKYPNLQNWREAETEEVVEVVGHRVRSMMPSKKNDK